MFSLHKAVLQCNHVDLNDILFKYTKKNTTNEVTINLNGLVVGTVLLQI